MSKHLAFCADKLRNFVVTKNLMKGTELSVCIHEPYFVEISTVFRVQMLLHRRVPFSKVPQEILGKVRVPKDVDIAQGSHVH